MQIKHDKEKDYADFTAAQNTNASGQAMVQFIETWSGMMECMIDEGASNVNVLRPMRHMGICWTKTRG